MGRKTAYNLIVTDDLWEKVNKENRQLLSDFIDYKRSSDKSPNTLYQYESILKVFFVWNLQNNNNKFFVDMKKREFIRFFNYMVTELRSSPNRIITVRATLSSLSNYIEDILDEEYEDFRNIVCKIETVAKEPVRKKTVMSQEDVDSCLEKLIKDGKYQIACYLALAVSSGARKAELLRFKCDYFKDEDIIIVEPNKSYNILGINFSTVRAYNVNKEYHPIENDWVGYILNIDEIPWYFQNYYNRLFHYQYLLQAQFDVLRNLDEQNKYQQVLFHLFSNFLYLSHLRILRLYVRLEILLHLILL